MSKLIIRQMADGSYQWQGFDGAVPSSISGSGNFDVLLHELGDGKDEAWLLLPGEHFFIKTIPYSDSEKRHLRQAAPYQLEDSLVEDIDNLHFALGAPANGLVGVAACNRGWLLAQLQPFSDAGIELARVAPQGLMLRRNNDGWALRLTGKSVLAHTGPSESFVMEPDLAVQGLKLLRKRIDAEQIPVVIAAANQQALDHFSDSLESIPGLVIEHVVQPWWQGIDAGKAPEIDLRQGEFGRRLPVERWWRHWRNVAIFAGITLAVYLVVSAWHYNVLENRNLELREQTEKAFRSVVPRGAIIDPEKQLRGKLKNSRDDSGTSAAVATLAKIAPVISASDDITLRAIHYSGQEMRISFWADSFNSIEQARAKIAGLGMAVELIQASADGGGHQARLRIKPEATG